MKKTKHTPPPWAATAVAGFGYRYVFLPFPEGTPEAELEANRRVADAAPALLAVCEQLLWEFPDLPAILDGCQGSQKAAALVAAARDAVTQARGGAS